MDDEHHKISNNSTLAMLERKRNHLLLERVVRNHLILGGTEIIRQTAQVVLETANGRLP